MTGRKLPPKTVSIWMSEVASTASSAGWWNGYTGESPEEKSSLGIVTVNQKSRLFESINLEGEMQ